MHRLKPALPEGEYEAFTLLLVLCEKYGIHYDNLPVINFGHFLAFAESETLQQALQEQQQRNRSPPLFQAKVDGHLTFSSDNLAELFLPNLNRLHSLNIGSLKLTFKRNIKQGELTWIKHLNSLQSLALVFDLNLPTTLDSESIVEFMEVFSTVLLGLEMFSIDGYNVFNSIPPGFQFQWGNYWPNLTQVQFSNCEVKQNLIGELTVLEMLSKLMFTNVPNLDDVAFTNQCVNRYVADAATNTNSNDNDSGSSGGGQSYFPAIACFKALRKLHVESCPLLTDVCINTGIIQSKTLKTLAVVKCPNISTNLYSLESGRGRLCIVLSK